MASPSTPLAVLGASQPLARPTELPLVHLAGGELLTSLEHPGVTTFEEMYRTLPADAWYDPSISPTKPVQFEIGSFAVPQGKHLWIFDYQFQAYRFSGVDPNDILPVEDGRLATVLGYYLSVSGRTSSHLVYQLDPVPVATQRASFQQVLNSNPQQRAPTNQFDKSAFQSFAATSSQGVALLPSRRDRQGALNGPFTIIAKETDRVALTAVMFRRVPIPLGCIEGRHMGYLIESTLSDRLLSAAQPR